MIVLCKPEVVLFVGFKISVSCGAGVTVFRVIEEKVGLGVVVLIASFGLLGVDDVGLEENELIELCVCLISSLVPLLSVTVDREEVELPVVVEVAVLAVIELSSGGGVSVLVFFFVVSPSGYITIGLLVVVVAEVVELRAV